MYSSTLIRRTAGWMSRPEAARSLEPHRAEARSILQVL